MGQGVSIILRFGRFLCFCLFTPLRPLRGSQFSLIFVCLLRWLALFVWFCPFFLFLILEFLRTSQADSLQEADEEEIWQLLSERILEVSFPSFCFLLSTRRIRGIAWQDRDKAFPLFFNLRVFYAFVSLWSLCVLKLFFILCFSLSCTISWTEKAGAVEDFISFAWFNLIRKIGDISFSFRLLKSF